jgi:hypothetical protein
MPGDGSLMPVASHWNDWVAVTCLGKVGTLRTKCYFARWEFFERMPWFVEVRPGAPTFRSRQLVRSKWLDGPLWRLTGQVRFFLPLW